MMVGVSDLFEIKNWVKQGCVLVPTLFEILFSMLLKHAFGSSPTDIKGIEVGVTFFFILFN